MGPSTPILFDDVTKEALRSLTIEMMYEAISFVPPKEASTIGTDQAANRIANDAIFHLK